MCDGIIHFIKSYDEPCDDVILVGSPKVSPDQLECIRNSLFGFSAKECDWLLLQTVQGPSPGLALPLCISRALKIHPGTKNVLLHGPCLTESLSWNSPLDLEALIGCLGTHASFQCWALQLLLGSLTVQTCCALCVKIHISQV